MAAEVVMSQPETDNSKPERCERCQQLPKSYQLDQCDGCARFLCSKCTLYSYSDPWWEAITSDTDRLPRFCKECKDAIGPVSKQAAEILIEVEQKVEGLKVAWEHSRRQLFSTAFANTSITAKDG